MRVPTEKMYGGKNGSDIGNAWNGGMENRRKLSINGLIVNKGLFNFLRNQSFQKIKRTHILSIN